MSQTDTEIFNEENTSLQKGKEMIFIRSVVLSHTQHAQQPGGDLGDGWKLPLNTRHSRINQSSGFTPTTDNAPAPTCGQMEGSVRGVFGRYTANQALVASWQLKFSPFHYDMTIR